MTANTQPVFPLTPKFSSVSVANADGTTIKTIFTAGSNGSRVSKLGLVSTDTANKDMGIYINSVLVGTIQCLLGAGTSSSVAGKDVLADTNFKLPYYDANGNLVFDLPASATLGIGAVVAVTAAKTITAFVVAADF